MKKFFRVLNKTEEIVVVALFVAMVAIIFFQVVMRKLNSSLSWSEELAKFIMIWLSWIGISIGEKRGEHIKISVLTDRFPPKLQHIFNIISEIIVILICVVTVYYGVSLVGSQWGTRYAGIHISVGWGYLSVVVGCSLMILRSLGMCWLSIKGIKNGEVLHDMIAARNAEEDGISVENNAEGGEAA